MEWSDSDDYRSLHSTITELSSVGGEGAVDERRVDPVDAGKLLGQHHHRAGQDLKDLAQRVHKRGQASAFTAGADSVSPDR
jgi:hypothetical protein